MSLERERPATELATAPGLPAGFDPAVTRKSYVCHDWNADLMPPEDLSPWNGVYRQKRAHLG